MVEDMALLKKIRSTLKEATVISGTNYFYHAMYGDIHSSIIYAIYLKVH